MSNTDFRCKADQHGELDVNVFFTHTASWYGRRDVWSSHHLWYSHHFSCFPNIWWTVMNSAVASWKRNKSKINMF